MNRLVCRPDTSFRCIVYTTGPDTIRFFSELWINCNVITLSTRTTPICQKHLIVLLLLETLHVRLAHYRKAFLPPCGTQTCQWYEVKIPFIELCLAVFQLQKKNDMTVSKIILRNEFFVHYGNFPSFRYLSAWAQFCGTHVKFSN